MTGFLIGAAVLAAVAVLLLLRPFLRKRAGDETGMTPRQMNAAVFRDELARLDRDLAEGSLSAADHAQARAELQKRALEDVRDDQPAAAPMRPTKTAVAVAAAVPALAIGLYLTLGNLGALNFQAPPEHARAAEVEKMVADFAARMEKNPGDAKGWSLLARSYKALDRPLDAALAYEKAMPHIQTDAQELASYADTAATIAGGNFAGKPQQLIDMALKVDPNNGMALWLAGTADLKRQDYKAAIAKWEKLQKLLPPESDDAREIAGALADARARAGLPQVPSPSVAAAPSAMPAAPPAAPQAQVAAAPSGASVSGVVELAAAVKDKAQKNDVVMVIARPVGTRMPVAVMRATVGELPLKFTLDDSLAMSPQFRISGLAEVEVEARVSKTGQAKAESGDLMSSPQTVKVGARDLKLQVDKVR